MAHLFVLKKRSNRLFCNNNFIAKINSLSLFNTFLQWTALFCYIFLRKLIFSFSIIYCSSIVNYFTITFLSPVPASRVIITEETPDPSFAIKKCRQEIVAKAAPATIAISHRKRLNRKIIYENLGRKIMTPTQQGLTLVLTPEIILLYHYLLYSSFSEPNTQQRWKVSLSRIF